VTDTERIEELERRVRELEARLGYVPPGSAGHQTWKPRTGDPHWIGATRGAA
jgi:hypothetical protein